MDKDKIIEVMAKAITKVQCSGAPDEECKDPTKCVCQRDARETSDAFLEALSEAGFVIMCQADVTSGGERSSSPSAPLQTGDGGEAEERISRLKAEIRSLHRELDDLRGAGDDEKIMLIRLKNDADIEAMDRAQLLQKIANLEAKYRFADLDGCVTHYLRKAAKETFAGNCAFVDDDLTLLTVCAKWALRNGIPDELCPDIFPKAKAANSQRSDEEPALAGDERSQLTDAPA